MKKHFYLLILSTKMFQKMEKWQEKGIQCIVKGTMF